MYISCFSEIYVECLLLVGGKIMAAECPWYPALAMAGKGLSNTHQPLGVERKKEEES